MINHCDLVKKLMEYLEFMYCEKNNISRIYDVCNSFYRAEKQDQPFTSYFMDFKRIIIPKTDREPLTHSGWKASMVDEINDLSYNGTCNLVDLPIGKKLVIINGCLLLRPILTGLLRS